jgi:hypothetical protein
MSKEITRKEAIVWWAERKLVEAMGPARDGWGLIAQPGSVDGMWDASIFNREDGVFMFRLAPEPPAKKFRPWTPGEVPIGAIVRPQDFQWRRLITGVDADGRIELYNGHVKARFMLDYFFHSIDGGKTWLPCGVEVVQ